MHTYVNPACKVHELTFFPCFTITKNVYSHKYVHTRIYVQNPLFYKTYCKINIGIQTHNIIESILTLKNM